MAFHSALILAVALFTAAGNAQLEFSYEGVNGPDRWAQEFPKCGGQRQSPVNILNNSTRGATLAPLWLYFSSYIPWEATLINNGHTAMVELADALPITLHGGPLTKPYVFQQMHFHWGDNNTVGSEHAINSRFSAMEMHMVFYKQEYGSPLNASNYTDGFTVLTTMLDLNAFGNQALSPIVRGLQRVPDTGNRTRLDTRLALESLLPRRRDRYHTYPGSLTTPPCDEAVTWIIFDQHEPISSSQVAAFRTLREQYGSPMRFNRRPLQPLNNRLIRNVSFLGIHQRTAASRAKGQRSRSGRRQ